MLDTNENRENPAPTETKCLVCSEKHLNQMENMHDYFLRISDLMKQLEYEKSTFSSLSIESDKDSYACRNFLPTMERVLQELKAIENSALGFEAEISDDYDASGLENASPSAKAVYVLNKMAPSSEEVAGSKLTYKQWLEKDWKCPEYRSRLKALGVNVEEISSTKKEHIIGVVNRAPNGGRKSLYA